jgi:hypothetical protein
MKNVKKILYVLFMTMSFLSFVACSDDGGGGGGPAITPIDTMGGQTCAACPAGFSTALNKAALGKNYDAFNAERFQVVMNFFGQSGVTWSTYPLNTGLAVQGFIYANQPITCDGVTVLVPQGQKIPLQTIQQGYLTSYYTVHGMELSVGGSSISMYINNAAISPMPVQSNAVDINGVSHGLVIYDYVVEFTFNGQVCPRSYYLGIQ